MAHVSRIIPSAFRAGARTSVQTSRRAIFSRAFSVTSAARDEKSIPVVSYKDGARAQETIQVAATHDPVSPPGADIEAVAQPLDPNVLPSLSPTMAKFTLFGKTAVITG